MILDLDETLKIDEGALYTKDADKLNIVFKNIDS